MVIPVVARAISGGIGPARYARGGAWIAVAGMLGLTFAELNTMRFGHLDAVAANEGFVGVVYGISCNTIGLGLFGVLGQCLRLEYGASGPVPPNNTYGEHR